MPRIRASLFLFVVSFFSFYADESPISLSEILAPPSLDFPLGGDQMGRNLFLRLGLCVRTLFSVWFVSLAGMVLGCALTLCLLPYRIGYWALMIFQYLTQILPVFLWVFIVAIGLGSYDLKGVYVVSLLFSLCSMSGCLLSCYSEDVSLEYWHAARLQGMSFHQLLLRYGFFGRWLPLLVHHMVFLLQKIAIVEISLSYLTLSAQEPQVSFGSLLSENFSQVLHGDFWIVGCTSFLLWITLNLPRSFFTMVERLI